MKLVLQDYFVKVARSFQAFFWGLHKPLVKKNKKLENIHAGETCFIFANGASLKNYDISKIPQNPSIVCAYQLIDKRMETVNVKYYVSAVDSYSLYSLLFNTYPHVRKFQRNKIRAIFLDIFKKNKDLTTFVNITNFYSSLCRRGNINYFHYFEDKHSYNHDLAGSFSNCRAALDTMLGVAKYLGFSKVILLGCDYLGTPPMMGHFYSDTEPFSEPTDNHLSDYRARVKLAAEGIDVTVILPAGVSSPDFQFDSYENYFGLKKEPKENKDFIDSKHLDLLRDAAGSIQAQM